MTKTYTPLIIEGKIYVVEQEPRVTDYGTEDITHGRFYKDCQEFHSRQPQTLPTLPEHAPYWEERIGQRVEVEIGQLFKWNDGNYMNTCAVCSERFMHGAKRQPVCKPCCEAPYAIPPQQKQGDEWDEAEREVNDSVPVSIGPYDIKTIFNYLRKNYSLTKK